MRCLVRYRIGSEISHGETAGFQDAGGAVQKAQARVVCLHTGFHRASDQASCNRSKSDGDVFHIRVGEIPKLLNLHQGFYGAMRCPTARKGLLGHFVDAPDPPEFGDDRRRVGGILEEAEIAEASL